MLYAQDSWSLLLVFQAMDAAGQDGTIKHHRYCLSWSALICPIVVVAGGRFFQGLWVWNGSVHRLLVFSDRLLQDLG